MQSSALSGMTARSGLRGAQWLAPALPAAVLLALLTWLLPNPLAEEGLAIFPGMSTTLPGGLFYIYMGSALTIALMNLVFYIWLKDTLYLHFAALVAAGLLYAVFRYRPDGLSLPTGAADEIAGVIYCGFCVVATTFFSQLFEFRRHWVWAARFFNLVAWFNLIAMAVALGGGYAGISRAVVFGALLSTSFGALFVLYLLLIKRRWQYLPAALSFAAPTGVGLLRLVGAHLPLAAFQSFDAPMLWFSGRLAEVCLLGVAVANRTRVAESALRRERSRALGRALVAERQLELKVSERTGELLQARNALQAALHNEREMRLEQRQFFNMINHEFRTPLTVVDSAVTELETFPPTDVESLRERLSQIRRASHRLMGLVDNCLINDRLDTRTFRLQLDRVPLDDLIEEAAELVRWSKRHQLRLELQHAPDEWECDPGLIRMALSNLVSNAIKYAKAGEIVVSVRRESSGVLSLSVSDEGPGIAPEVAERIFERYERGSETGLTSGHGLGLWITRRIARLHGGDIQIGSSNQGGSRFTFTLREP